MREFDGRTGSRPATVPTWTATRRWKHGNEPTRRCYSSSRQQIERATRALSACLINSNGRRSPSRRTSWKGTHSVRSGSVVGTCG